MLIVCITKCVIRIILRVYQSSSCTKCNLLQVSVIPLGNCISPLFYFAKILLMTFLPLLSSHFFVVQVCMTTSPFHCKKRVQGLIFCILVKFSLKSRCESVSSILVNLLETVHQWVTVEECFSFHSSWLTSVFTSDKERTDGDKWSDSCV